MEAVRQQRKIVDHLEDHWQTEQLQGQVSDPTPNLAIRSGQLQYVDPSKAVVAVG